MSFGSRFINSRIRMLLSLNPHILNTCQTNANTNTSGALDYDVFIPLCTENEGDGPQVGFKVHRAILASASDTFAGMIRFNLLSNKKVFILTKCFYCIIFTNTSHWHSSFHRLSMRGSRS
jgi:hypothetical protein